MQFEAIFLDLFGTLVDEATDYLAIDRTFADVADRFKLREDPRDLSGEYNLIVMELLSAEPVDPKPAPVISYEGVAKGVFEGMMGARGFVLSDDDVTWFWQRHAHWQKTEVRFFPDAGEAVRLAAAHAPHVGIITDADPLITTLLLPGFDEAKLIRSVTTGQEAGVFKPNRGVFQLAARKAGAHPQRCLMIGDSWERDVEGARAAGMQGILLDRRQVRTVDPHATIHSLRDLPKAMARVEGHEARGARP
ncbi:MAG: HAD family hydrolase [Thermoplasmatota archaeon]